MWYEGEWERWLAETPPKEKARRPLQEIWEEFETWVKRRNQIEALCEIKREIKDSKNGGGR